MSGMSILYFVYLGSSSLLGYLISLTKRKASSCLSRTLFSGSWAEGKEAPSMKVACLAQVIAIVFSLLAMKIEFLVFFG
jgi:hypothetical protein